MRTLKYAIGTAFKTVYTHEGKRGCLTANIVGVKVNGDYLINWRYDYDPQFDHQDYHSEQLITYMLKRDNYTIIPPVKPAHFPEDLFEV